ncbi:hypothetical protein ACHQM5_025955 [Ranunculus cassubicifolius]
MSGSFENYDVGAKKRKGKAESHTIDVPENGYMEEVEKAFWERQSIYKLHSYVKDRYENTYNPLLVSIGPYHHGKEHLLPMEEHKRRAFSHFIKRSRLPVEDYKSALMEDVQTLKEAYEQLDGKYWVDTDKFIELMLVDGCFILEFMEILSGAPKDYAPNDPIFSYYGCIIHYSCVMRDLLLLENQLPYLVLEKLVLVSEQRHLEPGEQRVPATLSQMMMFSPNMEPGRHMLDMYMMGLFQGSRSIQNEDQILHLSASQLYQVGIEFKKVDSFNDICFDQSKGTLNLPHININDYSTSTFMNLKAFELRGTTSRDFNSYIRLMESLIKMPKDVKLLEMKGIIVHSLNSDECVVKLLKNLERDTVVDKNCKSYMARQEMTVYYEGIMKQWKNGLKRHVVEWISNLKQTYFSNPWSIISVVAAFCLLVLTVLQTIYTIRSFYKQK